jgi:proliferating cell nuclear antigen
MRGAIPSDVLSLAATSAVIFGGDVNLSTEPEGLKIRSTNQARIGWVDISLSAAAFEFYQAQSLATALNLDTVVALLALIDDDPPLRMRIDDEHQTFNLQATDLSYTSNLLDPGTVPEVFTTSDVERPAKIMLTGETMDLPLTLANLCSSRVTLGVDATDAIVYGIADDFDDTFHVELTHEDLIRLHPADVQSDFPLDKLLNIQRAIPSDATVTLALGTDVSAEIQYPIANGHGSIQFTLLNSI